jgi:hypothetical protein
MALTPQQVEHYGEHGFVFPDVRFPEASLEAIRAAHARVLAAHPERPEFRDNCPHLLRFDLTFLNFARDEGVLDLVEQVIGPDIALWNMSFFAKPALDGKRTPWHQDANYWPIKPMAPCTVWVAVDDATTDNGCMRFIPGSHRDRRVYDHAPTADSDVTLPLELSEGAFDEASAVDVVRRAGEISLHDAYLFHGSAPNRSDRPRRGMTMRFMPTTSHFDRELAAAMDGGRPGLSLADLPLFLMRGTDRCGRNDFRVGCGERTCV